jgi:hypothetical protein
LAYFSFFPFNLDSFVSVCSFSQRLPFVPSLPPSLPPSLARSLPVSTSCAGPLLPFHSTHYSPPIPASCPFSLFSPPRPLSVLFFLLPYLPPLGCLH